MDPDDRFFTGAVARIARWTWILTAAGAIAGFALAGWRWSLAFLIGATASWLNFRWLKKLVDALGESATAPQKPPRLRMAVVVGLRYLVLGTGAYAILFYSTLSLTAALAGLFVAVAAVIVEILFELTYGK